MTRFFEFFSRGLEARAERGFLLAAGVLVAFYLALLGVFEIKDVPIDKAFFTQRDGVRIAHALANPLPVNRMVAVSNGITVSPNVAILDGWSMPEPLGIWTNAKTARLEFSVANARSSFFLLRLKFYIKLDAQDEQSLRLYGNDQLLGNWTFETGQATLQIPVRMSATAPTKLLRLEFIIGDPTRTLGSDDPRALGIKLNSIEIQTSGA